MSLLVTYIATVIVGQSISISLGLLFDRFYPASISVPSEAVRESGLRKTVFVRRADGTFETRDVQTGGRSGESIQITSGLNEGETIVAAGNFLLDSETRLHSNESRQHD